MKIHTFKDGERVLFTHNEGSIPAQIVRVCAAPLPCLAYAIIKVDGWLGTHWEPLSKLQPAKE